MRFAVKDGIMIIELNYIKGYKTKDGKYISDKSLVSCGECHKEQIITKYWAKRKGLTYLCHKCSIRKSKQYKISSDELNKLEKEKGYKLLSPIPKNSQEKCNWLCPNGHEIINHLSNLKGSGGCRICSNKMVKNETDYLNLAKKLGIEFIGPLPPNVHTKTKWKCRCGEIVDATYTNTKNNKMCYDCGIKKNSGKNHAFYNPNLSDKDRLEKRSIKEVDKWRKQIYKKFNYTCQKCHQNNCMIHAHHIFGWADYPELRFNIDNGICFCKECHREFHKKYGKINNNLNQLEEFLNKPLFKI